MNSVIPFGNPDSAHTDVSQPMEGFVSFAPSWGAIAMPADDLQARVIVGGKGAGKTAYIRRLYQHAVRQNDLYAATLESSPPATEHIDRLHVSADKGSWKYIWRAAILASLTSEVLFAEKLKDHIPITIRENLLRLYQKLSVPGSPSFRTGPYAHLSWMAMGFQAPAQRRAHVLQAEWSALLETLGRALGHLPPLIVALDCLDDELHQSPLAWSASQRGLFEAVLDLMQDHWIGNRLHVLITLRDIVYEGIISGPHGMKYRDSAYIRDLAWSSDAAEYFLMEKIKQLPPDLHLDRRGNASPMVRWLGFEQIESEAVATYILRHTRLLPRDIVQIGNRVCKTIKEHMLVSNRGPLPLQKFRAAVKDVTNTIAHEQLQFCAMTLLSQNPTVGRNDTSILARLLADLITQFKYARFPRSVVQKHENDIRNHFGCSPNDLLQVLWQNGLIGYQSTMDGKPTCLFGFNTRGATFPSSATACVMHTALVDSLGLELTPPAELTEGYK